MKTYFFYPFLLFLCFLFPLYTEDFDALLEDSLSGGITVDLREPVYVDGIIQTNHGGVITANNIRIQAQTLIYTKKKINNQLVWTIEAEGNLIVEFGEYVLVGDRLFYNFATNEGTIDNGKTSVEPWQFGGERFELLSDGSYLIYNGYVTTSERDPPEWGIYSDKVTLEENTNFRASNVHVNVMNYTILWIPVLRVNIDAIFDSPIRYRFRWGGRQGPRFGLTYEIFSWENWKTFFRFDYRLTRGPGAGIETFYRSNDRKTEFHSINYLAKDSSILHPSEKARFRFEGVFKKSMHQNKTRILMTYDKISDKDMPSYYYERDFDFDTSERTQLLVRREEENWIGNFYSRVRVNSFQTVKQQLPTLDINFKPQVLGKTGIIWENLANASYLDFQYSKYLIHVKNYSSSRFDYRSSLYRPISLQQYFTATPEIGVISVLYGDSQCGESRAIAIGKAELTIESMLHRLYGSVKHVIQPYACYRYFSAPNFSPHQHYIFDINDGWVRLNYLTFGVHNVFFGKTDNGNIKRLFSTDLYSYAFFDTNKIYQSIPKIYGRVIFFFVPKIKQTIDTAWNIEHRQLDYFNIRTEWTLTDDFAIAAEYRHRGPYRWRKVDQENFFLDVFRSENQLFCSPISDRRDTFLVHFFYRFHPNWAVECTSRQGWNRRCEPRYTEFEIDVLTTVQTAWNVRFSYQHQENDDRVAVYLNIGLTRPDPPQFSRKLCCFE